MSLCCMVINTTIPLVGRTLPQQLHSAHMSDSGFSCPQSVEHQWRTRSYTSSTRGLKIRTLSVSWFPREKFSRFGGGQMAQPYIHFWRVRRQNLDNVHKAQRRLQSWGRRLARAELRIEQRLYIGELPYLSDSSVCAPSTNEGDEDEPTNVTNCPGLVHQPQTLSWANGSWSQEDQSWQVGKVFGWRHSQDLWDPSEFHSWRWRPWVL